MSRKGFTLLELLVTLLIVSLFAAIAGPMISTLYVNIVMTRLNDTAMAVFMYSQHEFVYYDTCGRFDEVVALSHEKSGGSYVVLSPEKSAANSLSALLNVADGSSIVEFIPSSSSVVGVYFSERISSDELEEIYLSQDLTDESLRRGLRIGYYGGEVVQPLPQEHALTPKITVVNCEDLYLEITSSDIPPAETDSFEVELILRNGMFSETLKVHDLSIIDDTLTARILLDTMQSYGSSFAVRFPELAAGNITAEARIIYTNGDVREETSDRVMRGSAVTFSPLFESQDGNSIAVSCVRHLNNLRYISTADTTVSQTDNIAFLNVSASEFYLPLARNISIMPIADFAGVFDGNDNLIKNISLYGSSDFFALFGNVTGELRNVHLTGTTSFDTDAEIVGTLCGKLSKSGRIMNCSSSEISIIASAGNTVGGIVGICEGDIIRCSAVLDDITLGEGSTFGGIAGVLSDGAISLSHSSGTVESSANALICGISSGEGVIESCFSECTTRHVFGSSFFGISPETAELHVSRSYFVIENAWLALDAGRAEDRKKLFLDGVSDPTRAIVDSVAASAQNFPETVTQNGLPTRFGKYLIPEPRGLIGLVEVTFDDGAFSYDLRHCFDAFGNDSAHCPQITWDSPSDGESRIYLFRSISSSPEGGADGWVCTTDGILGDELVIDKFICQRVIGPETVTLRFADVTRTSEFYSEEVSSDGIVGVLAITYDLFSLRGDMFDPILFIPTYTYMETGSGVATHWEYQYGETEEAGYIPALDELEYQVDGVEYENRLYIFASSDLVLGKDYTIDTDGCEILGTFEHGGFTFYELLRSNDYFDPKRFTIDLSDGKKLSVGVELVDLMWSYVINFT